MDKLVELFGSCLVACIVMVARLALAYLLLDHLLHMSVTDWQAFFHWLWITAHGLLGR